MARPITAPRVPADLTPLALADAVLQDESALQDVHVTGGAPGLSARGLEVHEAQLVDVDLSGATLPHLSLRDVLVTGGSLANLRARGATVQRTAFTRVRLTGLSLSESTLRDVSFTGCLIDLASFAASRLERVLFDDCVLTDGDLADCRLTAAIFDGCTLTGVDLTGARFGTGCELRGCEIDRIRATERLRGVAMPLPDIVAAATIFAGALGVRALDDDHEEHRDR